MTINELPNLVDELIFKMNQTISDIESSVNNIKSFLISIENKEWKDKQYENFKKELHDIVSMIEKSKIDLVIALEPILKIIN